MAADAVALRVAALAGEVTTLRSQFQVFGDLAGLLATSERRIAAAEDDRRAAQRAQREAERREAAAMAAAAEMEEELARMKAPLEREEATRIYRRGYSAGYECCRRGAEQKPDPKPRLRSVAEGG